MPGLPLNLEDLIYARGVEDVRREFKASWDRHTQEAVVRTVAAFANDLYHLNGGYVIIGVATDAAGRPVLPPRGLEDNNVEAIQKEIRGQCNRIDPAYQPAIFVERFQERTIVVIWAPGGDVRPYKAPKRRDEGEKAYYVRTDAETVEAKGPLLDQLLALTARRPFDDRENRNARIEDISPTLVRRFLADVRSEMVLSNGSIDDRDLYRSLRIVSRVNSHEVPRNVALLFFHESPEKFFRGAQIDIVEFADEGDLIEERLIRGPLPSQIATALDYLNSMSRVTLRKVPDRAEVERTVAYPYGAMEEALVNAVYHRSYDDGTVEPTKVYLYPDRLEIISYPGPVPGVTREGFASDRMMAPVPVRNRRIGELLKELRLAEARGTGVLKIRRGMKSNGSPEPVFDFDDDRTYFRVTLPAHPQYRVINAIREASRAWATGDRGFAIDVLLDEFKRQPGSGALAGQIIEYADLSGDDELPPRIFEEFAQQETRSEPAQPFLKYADFLTKRGRAAEARNILEAIPETGSTDELVERAYAHRRAKDSEAAHRLLEQAEPEKRNDPRFLHRFARTKMELVKQAEGSPAKKRLLRQSESLLTRAIQLSSDKTRQALCHFDLARVLDALREPPSRIQAAFEKAIALRPGDRTLLEGYERWKARAAQRKSE